MSRIKHVADKFRVLKLPLPSEVNQYPYNQMKYHQQRNLDKLNKEKIESSRVSLRAIQQQNAENLRQLKTTLKHHKESSRLILNLENIKAILRTTQLLVLTMLSLKKYLFRDRNKKLKVKSM